MQLSDLDDVLNARKSASADSSYVASLYAAGMNKILEKVGEEAVEVILAAKDAADSDTGEDTGIKEADDNKADKEALVGEVADLWFHTLVMLHALDLTSEEVLAELARREGVSGHEEKASRSKS